MPATSKLSPRKRAKSRSEESDPESLHSDALVQETHTFFPKRGVNKADIEKEEYQEGESDVDLKDGQFKLHVYCRTEKEFKEFIEEFTDMLTEVDSQILPLPPKDVIHRIYRDIRLLTRHFLP
ncbi:hypothetical protein AZE42_09660 [Rhizopogon vesiculosus]|uniref:Uncharacterized protein n=1 Tax=Rhizopogon vesiculosus TaxID=180088 RepID=A0A1J8QZI6_9AGAM|nr:hypothetical protein AZE42_09660 [Rhizopogon vesiculosus]